MIYIQDRFTFTHNGIQFNDAIVLPEEEYKKLTSEEIETTKQERFENWKTSISTPPVEVEPTEEELQKQALAIDEQIQVLTAQKEELSARVMAEKPVKGVSLGVK